MAAKKSATKATARREQTSMRLSEEIQDRLSRLAEQLSRPGLVVTRSDALRVALLTGLELLEKSKK